MLELSYRFKTPYNDFRYSWVGCRKLSNHGWQSESKISNQESESAILIADS